MSTESVEQGQPIATARATLQWSLPPVVMVYVFAFLVLWTVMPIIVGAEQPSDNVEELGWASQLAWGYQKHPPMPTWIIYAFTRLLPATVGTTYVLGALQIAMMLGAAWLLTRQLLGLRAACIGVLLITCITFYTDRLHFFNHNTALLVATAASLYCLWNAVESGKLAWWAALGACWGIGMLSKYQMFLTIACNLAYLWTQRSGNTAMLLRRVAFAGTIGAALLAPHLLWVSQHDFQTFHYAMKYVEVEPSLSQRLYRSVAFSADQLLRFLPMFLLLLLLRRAPRPPQDSDHAERTDLQGRARLFLAIHAFGPLLLMILLCLLIGLELGMQWGTAFLWVLPLWYLSTRTGRSFATIDARTLLSGVLTVQTITVLQFALTARL